MPAAKDKILDYTGLSIKCSEIIGRTERVVIPISGNAKVGATAGWVLGAATNIATGATLPASQTASTLVVPLPAYIGDTVTGISVMGQVESAGGAVSLKVDLRKITNVAADNTDVSLGTGTSGSLVADTVLSSSNLRVTGMTEIIAEGEMLYALITATTAATTDIDLTAIVLNTTRA